MTDDRTLTLSLPGPAAVARCIVLIFTLLLPLLYDPTVPEVSGDIRWTWTHMAAIGVLLTSLWAWLESPRWKLPLVWPLIMWWALGLAIWAALSMVDSLSFDRGIVLIKAMYAQLILMVAVFAVWRPDFTRKLLWAMALPVVFTSWVGICQFMGWSDASFRILLMNTAGLGWLGHLWPENGVINALTRFYLQSAVPGSTFANKNLAGSYTAMMLPLVGYLMVSARHAWARWGASSIFALGMLFLVYSRSRASWVSLLLGIILFGVALALSPAWRKAFSAIMPWQKMALLLVPTALLLGMFGNAVSPAKGTYAVDRSPLQQAEALVNSSWEEVGGRLAYNLNSLAIVRDHWFNGVGLGAFFNIYPAYHDAIIPTVSNSYNVMARPQRTHTDVMQAFDEMGIPGGFFYCAVVLAALMMAWRMRNEEAVKKVGVFPLFGGLSLFVVGVNATMDFPMQLPTAPALAALLMGTLTAAYRNAYPASGWGWKVNVVFDRKLVIPAILLWAGVSSWVLWDDYKFRKGNQILKQAMVRIFSNVNDDETLRLINLAQETYPRDPRIQEHVAVVYANYRGNKPITLEERVAKLEWMLKRDPWGPNHLVNIGGQYLQLAEMNLVNNRPQAARNALEKAEGVYQRLQRVAGFSHFTWGIGGMLRLLQNRNAEAKQLLERALKLNPSYAPAVNGLRIANARLAAAAAPAQPTPTAPTAP